MIVGVLDCWSALEVSPSCAVERVVEETNKFELARVVAPNTDGLAEVSRVVVAPLLTVVGLTTVAGVAPVVAIEVVVAVFVVVVVLDNVVNN